MEEPGPSSRIHTVFARGVQTDVDLDDLSSDEVANILPEMLAEYGAEQRDWAIFAGEHWKQKRWPKAVELIQRGISFFAGGEGRYPDPLALANLHAMLAHLHLDQARTAPRAILSYAGYDKLPADSKLKDYHYTEAVANINQADQALSSGGTRLEDGPVSLILGKIILNLARGQPNLAQPEVERLLQRQPNNLIALTAQARLQFARRQHEAAMQTYQKLLNLNPSMSPDPRIGLGLCAWVLGDKDMAQKAWRRALHLDPNSWVSLLLLGLGALNSAREPSVSRDDRLKLETEGTAHVQRAFKLNNKSAASALALASISGQGGNLPLASKFAERAIQYSDNRRHTVQANAERVRLGFMNGEPVHASPFIEAARQEDPAGINFLAELTRVQADVQNGDARAALELVEKAAAKLAPGQAPLEFNVFHASLLAYPHIGMKESELEANGRRARVLLDVVQEQVMKAVTDEDWARLRGVGEDPDIFVELAKLWQRESLGKAISAYQTAVSAIPEEQDDAAKRVKAARINGNLGTLYHLQGNIETAQRMYQEALQKLGSENGKDEEVLRVVLAYNLGRACDDDNDAATAGQWYRDVLRNHPEHMESKVRLAALAAAAGRNVDAHNLLKECLKSDESDLSLRTTYTHFLISIGSYKEALAFTSQTLKFGRGDTATFCALGWLHFALGREAKTSQELAERPKQYLRSAEAYERALSIDRTCAMAAQGLAIALAEDTIRSKVGAAAAVAPADEQKMRARLAGQALGVFSRVGDSLSDGSVGVNMGHCYFLRGEEEKAIQSYEAASNIFKGRNVPVLLYLARAWYAYATKESNFSAMSKSLDYCQQAMHLQPSDRAILYNIAMIQQKAAEMLFAQDPAKRTLEELQLGLQQAQHAANLFRSLADDRSGALPYDTDLADQRARYGDGLLRRAPTEMQRQEQFESEATARVEEAREARAAEQARIKAAEAARRAEIESKAAELAEQRKAAREEALLWQEEMAQRAAEDEARKAVTAEKKKRRKERGEIESADEAEPGEDGGKRKKRKKAGVTSKKGRKVRSKSEISTDEEVRARMDEEDEAEASGADSADGGREDENDAAAQARRARNALAELRQKRAKKQRAADPDEDDEVPKARAGGKNFKSREFIEDSEDDDADADADAEADADADADANADADAGEADADADAANGMEVDTAGEAAAEQAEDDD